MPNRRALPALLSWCLAAAALLAPGLAGGPAAADDGWTVLAPDVKVRPLAEGVWLHRTTRGVIEANGLLATTDEGTVLVDTGWNDEQAERLLAWAAEHLGPVRHAVATHFHEDRTGGVAAVERHGVPVSALEATAELARATGRPVPGDLHPAAAGDFRVGGLVVHNPGPGHAPDNVVVWVPGPRVLFGGCAVKAADATDLGYVGDADLAAWPEAVRGLLARYADGPLVVVPGHGEPAGREALDNTLRLALAAAP
jgi:glyoxylase-like metal-dependent hydrolase (beta-lactamase superfamily II)